MNRKKMYLVVGSLAFFLLATIFFVISRSDTTALEARTSIFRSNTRFWTIVVLGTLILTTRTWNFLTRYTEHPVARAARNGLFILMAVTIGVVIYGKWNEHNFSSTQTSVVVAVADTVVTVNNDWSAIYAVPSEAVGAKITWTLLDPKGKEDCYQVGLSQGEFKMCPGQEFVEVDGISSFMRFKMEQPQEAPRKIVIHISKS
ncbi:MAG: hypothetical protein Q8Q92_04365 [bacterium]|nr:hypothetical protein [bacterium]